MHAQSRYRYEPCVMAMPTTRRAAPRGRVIMTSASAKLAGRFRSNNRSNEDGQVEVGGERCRWFV